MKLLSIDVGIKNLAYCLMQSEQAQAEQQAGQPHAKIVAWDVINLCGQDPCCSACKKPAKFAQVNTYFCTAHGKKSGFLMPDKNISLKKIKKMKLSDLQQVVKDYNITTTATKKEELYKAVSAFLLEKSLTSVASAKANDMDLVQIGIAMRSAFDKEMKDHLSSITHIVIENQISPIANRMKTLQGMIAQYFIMHEKTQIAFVSAANKLKGHQDIETDLTTYAARKKEGINITLKLLKERCPEWLPHFTQHKKKDDLADAFLQGNWYLKK